MSRRLSVVVVAYDMRRELPRTVCSLLPPYQCDIAPDEYEIVVVDNGSPEPVDGSTWRDAPVPVRVERVDDAPPSPAHAANLGIHAATGALVGLVVDGARIASPRLLATALTGAAVAPRAVVTAPAYHLGATRHMQADEHGYDQAVEDALLAASGWEADGYRLFAHSTLAGSSGRGWFGPMGESSSLFMAPGLWGEVGGLDEAFALPGGGLVNHDLYRRACARPNVQLVVMLGEGTFHQFHGGAATTRRYTWAEMHDDYCARRGEQYVPPQNEPVYIGRIPASALAHLDRSVQLALAREARAAAGGGVAPIR
jgi:hypothetical protein